MSPVPVAVYLSSTHDAVTCPCASLLPPSLPGMPLPPGHCYRSSKPQLRSRLLLGALGSPTLSGAFPWIPTAGLHRNSVSHLPPSRLCAALSFPRGQWLMRNRCTIIVCYCLLSAQPSPHVPHRRHTLLSLPAPRQRKSVNTC